MKYTVRAIWEGETLKSESTDSETFANAMMAGWESDYRRMDDTDGICVQMIDNENDSIMYEWCAE